MTSVTEAAAATAAPAAPSRATARIVGILFIAAILTYGPGTGLVESLLDQDDYLSAVSGSSGRFTAGALLMFANSAIVLANGALMFPVLRRHDERAAAAYLGIRAVEAALLASGIVALLSLVSIGDGYVGAGSPAASHFGTAGDAAIAANAAAYLLAMALLGAGMAFVWAALRRTALVPRFLATWGAVGYALLAAGAVLEVGGVEVALLLSVPGGLFELFVGVWLIRKGFGTRPAA